MNGEVLQGILLGESIPDIAGRLKNVTNMDLDSAVRNARTMVTAAENKGRLDEYRAAEDSGVILEREWVAAVDGRTRDLHRELDGQTRAVGEPFVVQGYEIMYPGDPSAHPKMVYNCRCTLTAKVLGFRKLTSGTLKSGGNSGIIHTGARITEPMSSEGVAFAESYYKEIRKRTTDAAKIAKNTGHSESEIERIKRYLFVDNSLYDEETDVWRQFDPDCAIAHSWQRLEDGKDIKPHDLTLIEHELYEMSLKSANPGMTHFEAHKTAAGRYNYSKESKAYYDSLKEHSQKRKDD